MSGIDRTQILRIDCPLCKGHGYVRGALGEAPCDRCEARGVLENEVPFKFETNGRHTREEVADAFGIGVDEVRDEGHSNGE